MIKGSKPGLSEMNGQPQRRLEEQRTGAETRLQSARRLRDKVLPGLRRANEEGDGWRRLSLPKLRTPVLPLLRTSCILSSSIDHQELMRVLEAVS